MKLLEPKGTHWFLGFFRDPKTTTPSDPWTDIERSIKRKGGLDNTLVAVDDRLVSSFDVFRPDGKHDTFGYALMQTQRR